MNRQNTEASQGMKYWHDITMMDTCHSATPRKNPKINYGLWVMSIRADQLQEMYHSGRGCWKWRRFCMCGLGGSIWEISAPSSQLPCEPTSVVKKKKS